MNIRYSFLFVSLVIFLLLSFVGCKSSDDPVTTGIEDCGITITSPIASAGPWSYMDELTIRWDHTGPAENVRIDLHRDNTDVGVIKDSTANDGYYKWTVHTFGENSGDDYSLAVTTLGDDPCSDEIGSLHLVNTVDCGFVFTGALVDTAQIIYNKDDILNITWDSNNTSGNVKIELIKIIGDVGVISHSTPDDGQFSWPVTSFQHGSYAYFMIRISDVEVGGCSLESDFVSIEDTDICNINFIYPGSHQELTVGDNFSIVFSMQDMTGNVSLWLYAGFETVRFIDTDVNPRDSSYVWEVTDFNYSGTNLQYRIRAISLDDPYCWGHSAEFTILQ